MEPPFLIEKEERVALVEWKEAALLGQVSTMDSSWTIHRLISNGNWTMSNH